jgi:DNA polymerase-3 subunit gamma/tau
MPSGAPTAVPAMSRPVSEASSPVTAMRSTGGALAAAPLPVAAEATPVAVPEAHFAPEVVAAVEFDPMPQSFVELVELFDKRREALIRTHLWAHVHLVSFAPGHIEFRPAEGAPRDLANKLIQSLGEWTGARWTVAISQETGAPTLADDAAKRDGEMRNEVAAHPLVRAVLDTFPGATIAAVRERGPTADAGADEAGITDGPADGDDENEPEED